jgi:tetratricopeptide (TPR) repeat protein
MPARGPAAKSGMNAAIDGPSPSDVRIPLPPTGSTDPPQKYWREYFSKHQPPSQAIADLALRLTTQKKYEQAIAVLEGALLNGQVDPWMYDVLALVLQLAGRPKAEVERALLSRLDFSATDMPSTLFSAVYLTRFGAKDQALKLYRQAANIEPTRPEAYVLGLRLARELKDYEAIGWAATGVLRTAWAKDHEQLHREAEDAALDAERALKSIGRASQAEAIRVAMAQARTRDLFVRLQWAGDGDLDLSVEEPSGTICSVIDPQSRGGGVHMHDGYGPDPNNCYEQYVCALGSPGVYVVRVRRVDGSVVGKRAQLNVVLNQGGPHETSQTFVLKLEQDAAAVRIPVPNGRRRQLAPEGRTTEGNTALLNRLIEFVANSPSPRQIRWSALPAAFAPGVAIPRAHRRGRGLAAGGGGGGNLAGGGQAPGGAQTLGQFGVGPGGVGQVGAVGGVGGGGLAVGFEPQIEFVPEGSMMTAAAVISSDLRYVRLAVAPNFSVLSEVFTFTFAGSNAGQSQRTQ